MFLLLQYYFQFNSLHHIVIDRLKQVKVEGCTLVEYTNASIPIVSSRMKIKITITKNCSSKYEKHLCLVVWRNTFDMKILIPIKGGKHDHVRVPLINALKGGGSSYTCPNSPSPFKKLLFNEIFQIR